MSGRANKRLRKFALKTTGSREATKDMKRVFKNTPRPIRGKLAREMDKFNAT